MEVEPSFQGYSLGKWIDEDGSGRFSLLEVETRHFKGPRALDLNGQAAGGRGLGQTDTCISPGMPRVTNGYGQMEVIVTPRTTYITVEHINDNRRIYADPKPRAIG